jgi:uncharacterized protein (DUF779 family)
MDKFPEDVLKTLKRIESIKDIKKDHYYIVYNNSQDKFSSDPFKVLTKCKDKKRVKNTDVICVVLDDIEDYIGNDVVKDWDYSPIDFIEDKYKFYLVDSEKYPELYI